LRGSVLAHTESYDLLDEYVVAVVKELVVDDVVDENH
jgi:hypothetical protein